MLGHQIYPKTASKYDFLAQVLELNFVSKLYNNNPVAFL